MADGQVFWMFIIVVIFLALLCFFVNVIRQNAKNEAKKAEKKWRQEQCQENANEYQSELSVFIRQCDGKVRTSETWEMKPAYEAIAVQKDVWNAVDEAFVPLQRLDDIVSELKAKASGGGK